MPMDLYHVFLGRPCKFDKKSIYDGKRNTYTIEKDGKKHTLLPLKDEENKGIAGNNVTLIS